MASLKSARAETIFAELAAEFINRESAGQSLITVTHAEEANRGRNITIYITVLPTTREAAVLDFLGRKRREFGAYVILHARMRMLPKVAFAIDVGEKNRQRMDELSNQEEAHQKQFQRGIETIEEKTA